MIFYFLLQTTCTPSPDAGGGVQGGGGGGAEAQEIWGREVWEAREEIEKTGIPWIARTGKNHENYIILHNILQSR